jgi:hypothetical protein
MAEDLRHSSPQSGDREIVYTFLALVLLLPRLVHWLIVHVDHLLVYPQLVD